MDLSLLTPKADQSAELHLRHPATDEPLMDDGGKPIVIRLFGSDSARYRKAMAELGNRRMNRRQKTMSFEQADAGNTELYAKCTESWSGIEFDGKVLKFSEENARKLYNEARWIRDQVLEFVEDRANFLNSA